MKRLICLCLILAAAAKMAGGNIALIENASVLSDYRAKGTHRVLIEASTHVVEEWTLPSGRMLVFRNLTDENRTVTLPGYKGVFREFRGSRTFVFSPFATQIGFAVSLLPNETIVATTDNLQDDGEPVQAARWRAERQALAARARADARRRGDSPPYRGTGPERLRLGIISDVHIAEDDQERDESVRRALQYFDLRGADGVIISGDLTENGTVAELRQLGRLWDEVFPGNRRSDGGHVEKLFIYGDHDVERFTSGSPGIHAFLNSRPLLEAKMRRDDIALNDRAVQWQAAFHEPFAPIVRKTVKGYDFVLAHLYCDGSVDGLMYADELYIPGLEEFFRTNAFDRARPLFYVQHKIPKGTVGGPGMPGQDAGRTSAILAQYPNAVAFCGHKHRSARDEHMLWQGAFTTLQVPGMNAVQTEAGYENGATSADRPKSDPPHQMSRIDLTDCAQGLFATVYDDRIVFERREFRRGGEIDAPWVVEIPNRGAAAFAARAARTTALPRFAADAVVTAEEIDGSDRDGNPARQIVVKCPVAAATETTPRAYAYAVRVVLAKGQVTRIVGEKRVFSPRGIFAGEFDTRPVVCPFAKAELPSDHDTLVFEVRPLDGFGRAGEPIASKPQSFNPTPSSLYPF